MKKNFIRFLAGTMTIAMVLSLAACGGNGGSSAGDASSAGSSSMASDAGESSQVESQPASDPSSSEDSAPSVAEGKFASIQEFLEDAAVKSQLDSMMEAMASDQMSIAVTADGDKLVYTFTFSDSALPEGTDMESIAATLEEGMTSQASTFETIAGSMKEVVEIADPKVVVIYAQHDGTEIYKQEFSAK